MSMVVPAAEILAPRSSVTVTTPITEPEKRAPGRPRKADPAGAAPARPRTRAVVPATTPGSGVVSVFEHLRRKAYPFQFAVELHVGRLVGGTPTDRRVAEGWIKTKMGLPNDELITAEVEKVMEERGVSADAAAAEVARNRNLSGFKRNFRSDVARLVQSQAVTDGLYVLDPGSETQTHRTFTPAEAERIIGECFVEGRQVKAMLKEAAMIAVGAGRITPRGWGETKKGMLGFLAEHLFVEEEEILLGVTEPSEVNQSFVHTWRGSGIKLEEIIWDAVVPFTLKADFDFNKHSPEFWEHLFLTGEENGLGASRSQGFGKFKTTRFDRIK